MTESKTIIIHSRVAIGYVGSNTTALVLQMGGYDVINVPTVLYSNHLGYATVGGGKISEDLFSDLLKGILKLEILKEVSTIITGFFGSVEQVRITADFIRTIKKYKPEVFYLCDPIMGDRDKGQYVEANVPDSIVTYLVPLADMLTPNQFEAERIINRRIDNFGNIDLLLQERFDLSKQKIVITGGGFDVSRKDLILNCIVENRNYEIIKTRKIDLNPPGTGELFTAHLHLSMLRSIRLRDAVIIAGDIVSTVLLKMYNENRTEFELRDILFSMNIIKQANSNERI